MSYPSHKTYPEENDASQENTMSQLNGNGRGQYPLSSYRAAPMPVLLQPDDESENLQAMHRLMLEHSYNIAGRLYKAGFAVHGLKELVLTITEAHKDIENANEATEAQLSGTRVHKEVVEFNRDMEGLLRGLYRDLVGAVGQGCIQDAAKPIQVAPVKKPEKRGLGGLIGLGFKSKEKIIIERVPMNQPDSIVPPEDNLFADLDV